MLDSEAEKYINRHSTSTINNVVNSLKFTKGRLDRKLESMKNLDTLNNFGQEKDTETQK